MSQLFAHPYVRRFNGLDATSAVVYTCEHPNPSDARQRTVSRAQTLARMDACLPGNRNVTYVAFSTAGDVLYDSKKDSVIRVLIDQFPIDRRSYPRKEPTHG